MHRLQDDYYVMRDLSCADPQIDPSSGVRGDSHFSVCSGSLRLLFSIGGGFVESLEDPYPIPCCLSPERANPNLRSTYDVLQVRFTRTKIEQLLCIESPSRATFSNFTYVTYASMLHGHHFGRPVCLCFTAVASCGMHNTYARKLLPYSSSTPRYVVSCHHQQLLLSLLGVLCNQLWDASTLQQ